MSNTTDDLGSNDKERQAAAIARVGIGRFRQLCERLERRFPDVSPDFIEEAVSIAIAECWQYVLQEGFDPNPGNPRASAEQFITERARQRLVNILGEKFRRTAKQVSDDQLNAIAEEITTALSALAYEDLVAGIYEMLRRELSETQLRICELAMPWLIGSNDPLPEEERNRIAKACNVTPEYVSNTVWKARQLIRAYLKTKSSQ
jgi:hypothetical protein